jgi:hypothetical protein
MHSKLAKQRARKLASTVSATAKRDRCRRDSTNGPRMFLAAMARFAMFLRTSRTARTVRTNDRGFTPQLVWPKPQLFQCDNFVFALRDRVINAGVISQLASLNLKHFW